VSAAIQRQSEIDIDNEVLDPVTPDFDDSPALPGWERVINPALTDDATLRITPGSLLTADARLWAIAAATRRPSPACATPGRATVERPGRATVPVCYRVTIRAGERGRRRPHDGLDESPIRVPAEQAV
jgi:hypothetical protein